MQIDNLNLTIEECENWIKRVIVGQITKQEIEKDRIKDINNCDLIDNTFFYDHPESFMEI